MRAILVTHTHWDREWYRTFQAFRARLVDAVDRVLEIAAADPGFRFLLDGQTIALEDYAEVRPARAEALRTLARAGRLALGPWYVQPDSLLPSGEAHVRNLLLGRAVGEAFGPVSRVAYTPDSFGHPAQFPQLFAGFGLEPFVYWRGHGDEIDALAPEWWWEAPDGSRVLACHLGKGYFNAQTAPGVGLEGVARNIARTAKDLAAATRSDAVLLMNGIDHALPDPRTADLAEALAEATGFEVERGLLDDFAARVREAPGLEEAPAWTGELLGARVSPLLPGVWSTRTWIKLENRGAEAALEGHAEPLAALAALAGLEDERPGLDLAWKALLRNQAHDSICGCSRDEVHAQMRARFAEARELAEETATRGLERLVGRGADRRPPWSVEADLAVWNPSPRTRTDVVRFPFDPHPWAVPARNAAEAVHPTVLHDLAGARFEVDGRPARLVPAPPGRVTLLPGRTAFDLEFVAAEVPAFGWRRVPVRRVDGAGKDAAAGAREDPAAGFQEVAAGGPEARIEADEADEIAVAVRADGTFDVELPHGVVVQGVGALEDTGDRGDTYDFDPVVDAEDGEPPLRLLSVRAERALDPSGLHRLRVTRVLELPEGLAEGRERRSARRVPMTVILEARVAPGVRRVDLRVALDHTVRDHRLRLVVPLPSLEDACAATTFDVTRRSPGAPEGTGWVQAPVATFPQQGFVHAGGVTVAAPGLPEAELLEVPAPAVAFTLLRAVEHLSRHDLHSRPGLAGPGTHTPEAQCPGPFEAALSILPGPDAAAAREAELGLRAVWAGEVGEAGEAPLAPEDAPLVTLEGEDLLLTAFKPAREGEGVILRILNPGDIPRDATLRLGFHVRSALSVRLDETLADEPVRLDGHYTVRLPVPPHALRSVRLVGTLEG